MTGRGEPDGSVQRIRTLRNRESYSTPKHASGSRGAWALLFLLVIAAILIAGLDLALYDLRLHHGDAYSFVYVRKYNAVADGHGLYHFEFYSRMDETCVRTLLPHDGYWPCWYVRFWQDDWTR